MNRLIDIRALRSFLLRELHTALLNRFVYLFCGVLLLAGAAPLWADPLMAGTETVGYALLQSCIYLIPLFALLIGVGSAQSEADEQALLMSQPIGRGGRVIGKFAALWMILAVATVLLVLPAVFLGAPPAAMWFLWLNGVAIGGIFAALGLAVGFSIGDRMKSHMTGLCVWLALLVGLDLLALAFAKIGIAEQHPQLWLGLLMANPLDALRIGALFELGRIPFAVESAPPLGRWWLRNLGTWFAILSGAWIAFSLWWSRFRLERWHT